MTILVTIKVELSGIQVAKTSLQGEAEFIIKRFFGTHTNLQELLELILSLNYYGSETWFWGWWSTDAGPTDAGPSIDLGLGPGTVSARNVGLEAGSRSSIGAGPEARGGLTRATRSGASGFGTADTYSESGLAGALAAAKL